MATNTNSRKVEQTSGNTDDLIRDAILRHLFTVHKDAKSPSKAAIGIRDLHKALKSSHGYKQQEVGSNLDYLVQKHWVTEVKIPRSYTTPRGTTQNSEQLKYKISDIGLDKLQKASLFQNTPNSAGINITNIHGVTVIGDGNVVNTNFTELSRVLTELKSEIQANTTINDEDKLTVIADIDTLQAQLQKPQPNATIIGMLWTSIEKIGKVAGVLTAVEKVRGYLQPFLG
jgi:hypothetical protein